MRCRLISASDRRHSNIFGHELHTVNLRLSEKTDELDHANSDLRNLFDSTEIATVFLDLHLIIRSFTTAIATIHNLIPSDQGRPLTDIASHVKYRRLREDVANWPCALTGGNVCCKASNLGVSIRPGRLIESKENAPSF